MLFIVCRIGDSTSERKRAVRHGGAPSPLNKIVEKERRAPPRRTVYFKRNKSINVYLLYSDEKEYETYDVAKKKAIVAEERESSSIIVTCVL